MTGRRLIVAAAVGLMLVAGGRESAAGGGSFGRASADATFDQQMTFSVEWSGVADRVEILFNFNGSETTAISQAEVADGVATYTRDMTRQSAPPNTVIAYRWRAVTGSTVTNGPSGELVYDDDRFSWRQATIGQATVYWYDNNEGPARRFGRAAAGAAERAGAILGASLAGGFDLFVYDNGTDFFGALGNDVREWTGAATYPELRTVFMRLDAGNNAFLDLTLNHEVTHVVWADATENPFHVPAKWMNEGFASWSERGGPGGDDAIIRDAARGDPGLFAFGALVADFPIRGTFSVAYAQSTTMIDMIIDTYGEGAMAALTAAFRAGKTDEEALRAATGESAEALYAAYFERYGVSEPPPIEPEPLLDSDVPLPPQTNPSPVAQPTPSATPAPSLPDGGDGGVMGLVIGLAVLAAGATGLWLLSRRTGPPNP